MPAGFFIKKRSIDKQMSADKADVWPVLDFDERGSFDIPKMLRDVGYLVNPDYLNDIYTFLKKTTKTCFSENETYGMLY